MKYIIIPIITYSLIIILSPIFILIDVIRFILLSIWNWKWVDYWCLCTDYNGGYGIYSSDDFSLWTKYGILGRLLN